MMNNRTSLLMNCPLSRPLWRDDIHADENAQSKSFITL